MLSRGAKGLQVVKHTHGHGLLVHWLNHSGSTFYPPKRALKSQSCSNDLKSLQYVRTHANSSKKEVMEDSSFLRVTELMPIKGQLSSLFHKWSVATQQISLGKIKKKRKSQNNFLKIKYQQGSNPLPKRPHIKLQG